jgi:hypothetical protein
MSKVAFVTSNMRHSAIHRGVHVAKLLNQSHLACQQLTAGSRSFDIYVHVKIPCTRILTNGALHVWDRIDYVKTADTRPFDAENTPTNRLSELCRTRICISIPHHVNIHCRRHAVYNARQPVVGLVGHVNADARLMGLLFKRYRVVREGANPCAFFNSIDVAIAWKKDMEFHSPQERFTNPIVFNIPTIGHRFHASYRDYANGDAFLCGDAECMLSKLEWFSNVSYSATSPSNNTSLFSYNSTFVRPDAIPGFQRLRTEIVNDVSLKNVRRLYELLFQILARKNIRNYLAPVPWS